MTFFPSSIQFNVVRAWWDAAMSKVGQTVASTVTSAEANGDLILSDGTTVELKIVLTVAERDQITAILDKAADRVKAALVTDATVSVTPPTKGPAA